MKRSELDSRLLREAFDRSFALPIDDAPTDYVDLVCGWAGTTAFALRREQLHSLQHTPQLTAVPGAGPSLLGIAVVRGRIVGVYSLARLLEVTARSRGHWLAVCGDGSLGLAFDRMDGSVRVQPERIAPPTGPVALGRGILHIGGATRLVLDLSAIQRHIDLSSSADSNTED